MDKNFVELVKKHSESEKRKEALSPKIVEARRNWWIKEVEVLYARVQGWLKPLIKDGTVKFETMDVPINEDLLGQYTIHAAIIRLGKESLEMVPVGSVILGSFGRLDVKGPNGQLMLILQATAGTERSGFVPNDGRWTIAKREVSKRGWVALTQSTFEQLFADLFGINAL